MVSGVAIDVRSDWHPNYVYEGGQRRQFGEFTEDEYHFGDGLVIYAMTDSERPQDIQVTAWDAPGNPAFEDFPMLRVFADYLAAKGRTKIWVEHGERQALDVAKIREAR
jgi:hypothetical protein